MFDVLHQLTLDHANLRKLLGLIERQLATYRGGGALDIEALTDIVEYLLHYPDLCHHPREDLIYRRLKTIDETAAKAVGDIESEHETLARLTRGFAAACRAAAQDVELPRAQFEASVRDFIAHYREHMELEETHLFPLALRSLTARDWWEIDNAVVAAADPLFGGKIERQFQELHLRILRFGA